MKHIKFDFEIVEKIAKLSYFAGIIDGEGSIGIEHLSPTTGRSKDYYNCRLCVINTNEDLMKLLVNFFKGTYNERKRIPGRKRCFRWHVFGQDLEDALIQLEPHLFIKKSQAQVVLEYRKTVGKTGWNVSDEILTQRKELWLKCKELNSVGEPGNLIIETLSVPSSLLPSA